MPREARQQMTARALRARFLEYFESRGHRRMPSSPLIPPEDPTLMFVNAGMVQFKDVFLGVKKAPAPSVATIQKCLRITGKHNDFDEVGFTNRHHTFFEMLGNFSFGGYFKEEAIAYAWEFLTEVCGLSPKNLYVSVHHSDQQAEAIWRDKIGLAPERIFKFDADNFWQMADVGPCGPCTEIHYDCGEHLGPVGGDNVVGGDGPRFVEVWNLVFMQYERRPDGSQVNLPNPCVDTGMGLERLAAVAQGVDSNYDTDELAALRSYFERATGVSCAATNRVNFHVACDHVRSILFLMQEGVFPSNEGRGYVLRRIARRALRFVGEIADAPHAISDVMRDAAALYGHDYPELTQGLDRNVEMLRAEEDRFFEVVHRGSQYIDAEIAGLKQKNVDTISGETAFYLHDTHGFPIDLTRVIAKQNSMHVDEEGFEWLLEKQRALSRGQGGEAEGLIHEAFAHPEWFKTAPPTVFSGYERLSCHGVLLLQVNAGETSTDASPDRVLLVFDQTPFYATAGGQVGDVGHVMDPVSGHVVAEISGCEKGFGPAADVYGHVARILEPLHLNKSYALIVNSAIRQAVVTHHTATHLLHAALRHVLGDHVRQQGSYVGANELRFDFSHHKKMTDQELARVDNWVNEAIAKSYEVQARQCSLEEAQQESTLMFFGEKYGEIVRQLRVGPHDAHVSLELCGGIHVKNTADIGGFEILSEHSIAQGVRRITALAGPSLIAHDHARAAVAAQTAQYLEVPVTDVLETVKRLKTQTLDQQKMMDELIAGLAAQWRETIRRQSECLVFCFSLEPATPSKKSLKKLADMLSARADAVVMLTYGEGAERRFVIWLGAARKKPPDAAKAFFESFKSELGLSGGGGGTQFQGIVPADMPTARLTDAFAARAQKLAE